MNNGSDSTTPQPPQPSAQGLSLQDDLQSDTSLNQVHAPFMEGNQPVIQLPRKRPTWLRIVGLALLVLGLAGGALLVLNNISANQNANQADQSSAANRIKSQSIALTGLSKDLSSSQTAANTLTVNGRVDVGGSLVLQPTAQPSKPVTGEIYYDRAGNNIAFYNGSQFVYLQGSTTNVNNITNVSNLNVTNISGGGGNVTATGTPGTLAMFAAGNQLADSLITQSGSTVTVGGSTIQVGSSAGVQTTTTVGSTFGASTTTIQGGTGDVNVATGGNTGVSGNISIKTGDSSTTASGNITIDTGVGVVDGELIEHKTFEGGLDNMNAWFGNTVAQSSAQAHTGAFSLAETGNAANWGIIETLPGVSVVAGHQYYFSLWVRAATTPRNITGKAVWNGTSSTVTLTPVMDSTTGWTEMTALGAAPGGATSVYFEAQSTGVNGEVHYFDDMTVTDLSSSSAASIITVGAANAKIITIGNINQIGATTINGGSGITLNSSAAGTTINGGVITVTGSAASSITTTAGSLTLTSAESTSWGVGTATSGVGGTLTVHGGRGGTDAVNNGGNLVLQGGGPNGAGTPGSVIVQPVTNSSDTFLIQNSSSTPFFRADSSNMVISVVGTNTTFAKLQITDAHITSTQTTPPTIGTPANCGTTPTAAITAGSTDVAGSFTITTGTGGTSSSCDTIITFHQAYGAAPKSIIVVGKTDAASVARQIFVSTANTTTFTTSFAVSAGGANSTPYTFNYWVVE